ncbi:MAG TPA: HAMP domain-containing sensor histidine kinase [Solirubrobacteraceae bacterium]|nr:HAMP domain-containing sensor histidine kinase [Solirubrobacteraceae bacterium]
MRRRRSFGLRPRLVLALVATSALTLAVAAATVLSPLERRLQDSERESVTQAAATAQAVIADLTPSELAPGAAAARSAVKSIAKRADGEAVLVDEQGRVVAPADPDPDDVAAALRALRQRRTFTDVLGGEPAGEVRVARPLHGDEHTLAIAVSRQLDTVRSAAGVVRRAMVTAALVGLGVALLVGIALASELARRLRRVRDTALLVARLGPVAELAPTSGNDEIADLARAFSVMQERLREQEEARRTFVSTASHELRTPLTSLQLALALLREEVAAGGLDAAAVADQLDHASAITGRISALAAQLLDLSRLDAGVPARSELIELRETCRAVISEFAVRAAETDRRIELAEGDGLWAVADPDGVAQIVRVLLDNALRFAPPGTAVFVELTSDSSSCVIAVQDRGPGVPDAEREQIFERFRRGTETGGEGGFGLGLAIARELARRMGGDVVLVGGTEGARFELRLVPAPVSPDLQEAS